MDTIPYTQDFLEQLHDDLEGLFIEIPTNIENTHAIFKTLIWLKEIRRQAA